MGKEIKHTCQKCGKKFTTDIGYQAHYCNPTCDCEISEDIKIECPDRTEEYAIEFRFDEDTGSVYDKDGKLLGKGEIIGDTLHCTPIKGINY